MPIAVSGITVCTEINHSERYNSEYVCNMVCYAGDNLDAFDVVVYVWPSKDGRICEPELHKGYYLDAKLSSDGNHVILECIGLIEYEMGASTHYDQVYLIFLMTFLVDPSPLRMSGHGLGSNGNEFVEVCCGTYAKGFSSDVDVINH
jgi:hypothetical protein